MGGKLPFSTIARKAKQERGDAPASRLRFQVPRVRTQQTSPESEAVTRAGRKTSRLARKSKKWRTRPTIIRRGDREICNTSTVEGLALYRGRVEEMLTRQGFICCVGMEPLALADATFEHEQGRGMGGGHRDDRTHDSDGNPINGASCLFHNSQRGSRRKEIFKGIFPLTS